VVFNEFLCVFDFLDFEGVVICGVNTDLPRACFESGLVLDEDGDLPIDFLYRSTI
jgi:hypothetical protein